VEPEGADAGGVGTPVRASGAEEERRVGFGRAGGEGVPRSAPRYHGISVTIEIGLLNRYAVGHGSSPWLGVTNVPVWGPQGVRVGDRRRGGDRGGARSTARRGPAGADPGALAVASNADGIDGGAGHRLRRVDPGTAVGTDQVAESETEEVDGPRGGFA